MAFKAALRQLCLLTFCSRSFLPKALFEPRPPDQRNMFAIEISKMICLHTSLANPEQYHKCRILELPSRPPCPSIWESSHTSLGSPGNNNRYHVKKKSPMQTVNRISGVLLPMPAHLVLMSSLQSLRSNDELLQKCLHPAYPVLKATITISFSSLVLSPLSFSMWEGPKSGTPRGSTLSLAHSADDTYQ